MNAVERQRIKAKAAKAAQEKAYELDNEFLKSLAGAMERTLKDDEEKCWPHAEACRVVDWTFDDFLTRLQRASFRNRYARIMGEPPTGAELTNLWVMTMDEHVNLAKHGHATSVQFLMRHHGRFKPKAAGRPAKAKASDGTSDAERRKRANALYKTLMVGTDESASPN